MYVVIAGGGKVGLNLARELLSKGFEVTLIEQRRDRYTVLEDELEHAVQYGDATEMWVLERAGILRADLVVAVTGDDEDNIVICQMAREKYLCDRIVARVNNPNNLEHFELLGIRPSVSATNMILRLIEHEVPNFGFVHLLELNDDKLEIIEIEIAERSIAAGAKVSELEMPEGSLVISVLREDGGVVPTGDTVLGAGEEVLVVLSPGLEAEVSSVFTGAKHPA